MTPKDVRERLMTALQADLVGPVQIVGARSHAGERPAEIVLDPARAGPIGRSMLEPDPDDWTIPGADARSGGPLMSRRGLVEASLGATVGLGALSGCKPCFAPKQPGGVTLQQRGPRTLTLRARIKDGEYRELRTILDADSFRPFVIPVLGIHYARLFTTDHYSLFFMVIYDDYDAAIDFLCSNADGVDALFELCEGYPEAGARDRAALERYVWTNKICVELFYRAYDNPQAQIRDALTLRQNFLAFLREADGLGGSELSTLCSRELYNDPHLQALMPPAMRARQGIPDQLELSSKQPVDMAPLEPGDRVNPFTLLARLQPGTLAKVKRILQLGTFATIDLGMRPLKNLPTLHFARVSVFEDTQELLFASVYDGDFIQYVEDFGTRIAKEIDTVFGACIGYPLAGSRDVAQFKEFLASHQIQTNAFGGTYLNHSVLQIQSSLELSKQLERFRRSVDPDSPKLRAKLDRFLHDNQLLLT